MKKLITFVMTIAIVAAIAQPAVSSTASADDSWTQRQEQAHQIAELARQMDLPETDPIITRASEIWRQEAATPLFTDTDAVMIAKVLYNEARGIQSETEKACIVWAILNRVDAGYASTISGVITARNQFAYRENTPVRDDLLSLSYDVLSRWDSEKQGQTDVGRVLPSDYLWYTGNGLHNYYRNTYSGGKRWDYTLSSPYTT